MTERYWIIVNLDGGEGVSPTSWDAIIAERHRPKYMHGTRESAETELLRLKQASPLDEFVLFESVAYAKRVGNLFAMPGVTAFVVEPIPTELAFNGR